jgi:hypothetical protein
MNKITELIDEVTRMISDLHDGQNPAWQRPDDKEIIKLLEKVWVFLENFEPFDESSKEELDSLHFCVLHCSLKLFALYAFATVCIIELFKLLLRSIVLQIVLFKRVNLVK